MRRERAGLPCLGYRDANSRPAEFIDQGLGTITEAGMGAGVGHGRAQIAEFAAAVIGLPSYSTAWKSWVSINRAMASVNCISPPAPAAWSARYSKIDPCRM